MDNFAAAETPFEYLVKQWRAMVSAATLAQDAMAGVVVAFVALPLNLAFAAAAQVDPQVGLVTGIVGGLVAAWFGGSSYAVSGPAAVMAVLLVSITEHIGWGGLLTASLLCGAWQLLAGLSGLGILARLVPRPVVSGFTSGLAVLIVVTQVRPLLGLDRLPDHARFELWHLATAPGSLRFGADAVVGLVSLVAMLAWPRRARVPAGVAALLVGSVVGYALRRVVPGADVARLEVIALEGLWPTGWQVPWGQANEIVLASLELALLASLQSVLCALSCDSQTGTRHNSNQELIGQGLANLATPWFGGLPVTGVFARSAAGIRAGGKTRMMAVFHALVLLGLTIGLTPVLEYVPLATLAAILLATGLRLFQGATLLSTWRASRAEGLVLIATLALTAATTNMAAGMAVGTVAAMSLVAWRAARQFERLSQSNRLELDAGATVVWRLEGPLFFGSAPRAVATVDQERAALVVVDLEHAWGLDTTSWDAFEQLAVNLRRRGQRLQIVGLPTETSAILVRAGFRAVVAAIAPPAEQSALSA